jgi:hypothetical protein
MSKSKFYVDTMAAGAYLSESEQQSCVVLDAATSINGIICTVAVGYLVEQLPG